MAGLQLSGLASGLDWKSLVEQLMEIEAAPITRIQSEQSKNSQQSTALRDLGTRLSTLQTATQKLKDASLFSGRTATSNVTASSWKLAPGTGTPAGSYEISVSQLATKAKREGALNITGGLAASSDVSGVTLATMRTASVVTSGSFTVNGAKVTLATTDSLQSVFDAISTATGGDVTASYDATNDKVTLTKATPGEIVLGAANDTSNFLQVLKLANNGTGSVASHGTLGTARTGNTIANSGLTAAITAVDGSGNGSFSINGVAINYNVNTDSLNGLLKKINSSTAGVTASYDAVNDRMTLSNNVTGDLGITLSEGAGGVLAALGLTTGGTSVRGQNAQFSIDGGPTLSSSSNTLDGATLGVSGLSVTVDSQTTQTITVASDTAKMRSSIDSFVSAYNAVQLFIDEKSKVTNVSGKVTASVLSSNRDVQDWARQLRNLAFNQVSGVGGIDQLDDLGLDLDQNGQMSVKDADRLTNALTNKAADVESFFGQSTTGFASRLEERLKIMIKADTESQDRLTKANAGLDKQIEDLQRRLEQQRELLTASFVAMESAQSRIQQQGSAIANAFGATSK